MAVHEQLSIGIGTHLLEQETLETMLDRMARSALQAVPSAGGCGVMLVENGQLTRRAATDAVSERLDDFQARLREGPAMEALVTAMPVRAARLPSHSRWERFTSQAVDAGVRACLSVPLPVPDRVVGVVTLYATMEEFPPYQEDAAERFAAQAAVTLANTAAFERLRALVDQLNQALESRDVIGQAKGVLMVRENIGADEAFDRLRTLSQARNQKLRDLAGEIAASLMVP